MPPFRTNMAPVSSCFKRFALRTEQWYGVLNPYSTPCSPSQRSASMAALQPMPAAVIACR